MESGRCQFSDQQQSAICGCKTCLQGGNPWIGGGHKLGKLNVERGEVGGLMGIVYVLHVFVVCCLWFVVYGFFLLVVCGL